MRWLRNWFTPLSIRRKLNAIILLSCVTALIFATAVALVSQRYVFSKQFSNELKILAQVIGENSRAAVMFGDTGTLQSILSSLAEKPDIIQAYISDADDVLLATYNNPSFKSRSYSHKSIEPGVHIRGDRATVLQILQLDGEKIGYLRFLVSLDNFQKNQVIITLLLVLSFALALLVAMLFSNRILGVVLDPILSLNKTMETISKEKQYTLRTEVYHDDELGKLAKGFNNMIGEIQARDVFLEEQVEERTEDLKKAKDKAEAANRAKSEFLANMSHEIRTPMNAIIGMTHLALQANPNQKQQKFLMTVKHSADNLLGILNDILDFSKIEAGQLQLNHQPFLLDHVITSVFSTMQMLAHEKGLSLNYINDSVQQRAFIGDDLRFRQILFNLIGNAIKFTQSGSVSVYVETGATVDKDGKVTLIGRVEDTGIGIESNKLKTIFKSFEQADNSYVREYGGTGLGLAISQQLTSMMGGSLEATSQPGIGSVFSFSLFLEPCKEDEVVLPALSAAARNTPLSRLRILVVDDNEVNRDLARMVLEKDHDVQTAINGQQVLQKLCDTTYDVVLMDVQMPVMDGLSATRIIRNIENGEDVDDSSIQGILPLLQQNLGGGYLPVIAMTAHAMAGDQDLCLAAGMDGYVTKPFHADQLYGALQMVDGLRGAETSDSHVTGGEMRKEPPRAASAGCNTSWKSIEYIEMNTGLTTEQAKATYIKARQQIGEIVDGLLRAFELGELHSFHDDCHQVKGLLLQCGLTEGGDIAQALYDLPAEEFDKSNVDRSLLRLEKLVQGLEQLPEDRPTAKEIPQAEEERQVLVLEDNLIIQEVVGEMSQMLGLTAKMTTDGSETFDQYRQRLEEGRAFDFVLLDLNIPRGMGGLETAQNILALDPDARLVVCSGNSEDPVMREPLENGFLMSLTKPYSFDQFKNLISQVADSEG